MSQTDLTAALKRLIRMAEAATPGPWEHKDDLAQEHVISSTNPGQFATTIIRQSKPWYWNDRSSDPWRNDEADHEFIIAARTALPALAKALLACVEALAGDVQSMHREDDYGVCFDWCPACKVDAAREALDKLAMAVVEANRG